MRLDLHLPGLPHMTVSPQFSNGHSLVGASTRLDSHPRTTKAQNVGSEGHRFRGCAQVLRRSKSFPMKEFRKESKAVRLAATSTFYSSYHRVPGILYQILYHGPMSPMVFPVTCNSVESIGPPLRLAQTRCPSNRNPVKKTQTATLRRSGG